MNKYDFIEKLLNDKKLTQNQREKVIELTAKEFKKDGDLSLELKSRVEGIEKMLKYENNHIQNGKFKTKSNKQKKYHNPKRLVEALSLFSKSNSHIKYSTHIWDENLYDKFKTFIAGVDQDFKNYKLFELKDYNSNLYWKKIYPFLFQKKLTELQKNGGSKFDWGKHKIKIGWQYPDTVKKWCEENFDDKKGNSSNPFSMEIPDKLLPKERVERKTVKYFEDVINIFKNEIEFRDNRLFLLVKTAISQEIPNFTVDEKSLETLKGKSFFTNTEYVIKAITRMLTEIKSRPENTNVLINCQYDRQENNFILNVLHKDSFSLKELDHSKIKLDKNMGNLEIIRTTLNSLCDFSIESKFRNEDNEHISARIDYLYAGVEKNNWEPRVITIPHEQVDGFKYILKFPAL